MICTHCQKRATPELFLPERVDPLRVALNRRDLQIVSNVNKQTLPPTSEDEQQRKAKGEIGSCLSHFMSEAGRQCDNVVVTRPAFKSHRSATEPPLAFPVAINAKKNRLKEYQVLECNVVTPHIIILI